MAKKNIIRSPQKKLLHIVGTRPQYIKLFPLFKAFESVTNIQQIIYDSGQHYDDKMSGQILKEFGLTVEAGDVRGLSPEQQIPLMIGNIWQKLNLINPDYVMIYGDTNTTLAATIACAKQQIPFGHVEAGGRTLPSVGIQEGINRKVADHLSTHLFCANEDDAGNLYNEGISPNKILLSGDVMIDSFKLIEQSLNIEPKSKKMDQQHLLVTVHRAENVDHPEVFSNIVDVIIGLSKDYRISWPLHPRAKGRLTSAMRSKLENNANINLLPPLTYKEAVTMLKQSTGLITDSGGMAKDAACAGIVSMVLRDDPIWKELAGLGYIKTVGIIEEMSAQKIEQIIRDGLHANDLQVYSPEMAAPKIVKLVTSYLNIDE